MATFLILLEWLKKKQKNILLIFALCFWVAAIGYSLYLDDRLPYPDERWYFNDYAQNLANQSIFSRDGINPTAFHPPAYPLALSGLVSIGLGITAARLMNFLAFFVTLISLYFLLKNHSHKLASIIVVLLALAYPVLFYTAGTLYPQTFGATFFILAIMFYWKEPLAIKDAVLAGISMGIAILTIPTFLFVPFFMVLFSLIFRRNIIKQAVLLLIMVFITIAPWTIRNYLVFHRFELVSSNFGTNFLLGNSPQTTPNNGPAASIGIQHIIEEANSLGLDEFERDEFYTQQALVFIQADPIHYISLYFLKVVNYFNFRNELLTASESSLAKDFLMLVTYGSFLLLAVFRILLIHQKHLTKLEIFMILLYIGSAFVSALAFSRIRYRLPFDYLLIIQVSIFLETMLNNYKLFKMKED